MTFTIADRFREDYDPPPRDDLPDAFELSGISDLRACLTSETRAQIADDIRAYDRLLVKRG